MLVKPEIDYCGDNGLILKFTDQISIEINETVRFYSDYLQKNRIIGIIELIPAYNSLLIIYDPVKVGVQQLIEKVKQIKLNTANINKSPKELITIPVLYGEDYGPDLKFVAEYNNLSETEVIRIHTTKEYFIYMLGFTPGFPYLGGLDKRIETPRLKTPRTKISAGSVGIAGNQTGVYPLSSPGGWQIIGRTPLSLFNPKRKPATLLKAGQYLCFQEIDFEEYERIEKEIKEGKYRLKKTRLERDRV